MSKKTLSKIILSTFLFGITNISFAEENSDPDFSVYQNRVETICSKYDPKKEISNLLKKPTDYENPYKKGDDNNLGWSSDPFLEAKKTYKKNMNNMYKCSLLKIQINELENLKKLFNIDKTGEIKKSIEAKITKKITKLETIAENGGGDDACANINKKKEIKKEETLKNVTYETCKYVSYLDFLKLYYNKTKNLTNLNVANGSIAANSDGSNSINNKVAEISADITTSTIAVISNKYNKIGLDINNEEKHVITTFPIAFQSYNEYAYNYPLHILLEIIKEDLIIFRDKLHATINPINQVVYKISNAMSK